MQKRISYIGLGGWGSLFVLFTILFPCARLQAESLPFDREFPPDFPTLQELTFKTLAGEELNGKDLMGEAVAVVFFLPTCPKCTGKLPKVDQARKTFEAEGLKVVAFSSKNDVQGIRTYSQRHPYDWVWGSNASEIRKKLGSSRTFEIFLYDRKGKIAFHFKDTDAQWYNHFKMGVGAVCERALDLTSVSRSYDGFAGSLICSICHEEEMAQWEATPHAQSFKTLQGENSHQKVDCISCHVTGEAGLASRPWRISPKKLQAVGCEECHGPGGPHRLKDHPRKSMYSIEESSCVRCHDEENSPDWNYKEYLSRVVHSAQ